MNRENEILKILTEEPFISHDEIANRLGITRSTVGVHILNLQKKGAILGRGYILAQESYICGVGSVNVDIYGKAKTPLKINYDHPSSITTNIGGVTHNILENLVHLGLPCKFISAIGDDLYGKAIIDECHRVGIDVSHFLKARNASSGVFMQVLDDQNDMYMALTDFTAMQQLSSEYLVSKSNVIQHARCVVCDPALDEKAMDCLLSLSDKVYVDPTSQALAARLIDKIGQFYFAKPNRNELQVLSGYPTKTLQQVKIAAQSLIDQGLEKICVSLGDKGCYYLDRSGNERCCCFPAEQQIVNASGAGDAFMAAFIYSEMNHFDLDTTLNYASAAGIAAIRTQSTINDQLSVSLIEEIIKEKRK